MERREGHILHPAPREVSTLKILSACAFDCPDACGFEVRWGSSQVRGRDDHPYTRGFVCRKLTKLLDALEGPRPTQPMLREGGVLNPISWDRALSILAGRIESTVKRDPRRILWGTGSGNLLMTNCLLDLFSQRLGGFTGLAGSLCGGEGGHGLSLSYPVRRHVPPEEVLESRRILLWGRNVAETNVHFVPLIARARAMGAKVGYLDVRPTRTHGLADAAWTLRPGSDLALGAFLCGEVLRGGGGPVGEFRGLEEFEGSIRWATRQEVGRLTGLSSQELDEILQFVTSDGPLSLWAGWAMQRRQGGDLLMRVLDSLVFLLGSQDVPGGGMVFSADDGAPFPPGFAQNCFSRLAPRPVVGPWLKGAQDPPVELVIFSRCNPVTQTQGVEDLLELMDREDPFFVCLDWRLSATASRSHLFIPVAPFPEQPDGLVFSYWHDLLQVTRPVRRSPCPSEADLLDSILRMLGFDPCVRGSFEPFVRQVLSNPGLVPVAEGIWRFPHPDRNRGAFSFPLVPPVGPAGDSLTLVTPHRFDAVNGGGCESWAEGDGLVFRLSPREASRLGLRDRQRVAVRSPWGEVRGVLRVEEGVAPGTCWTHSGQRGVNLLVGPQLTDRWNCCLSQVEVELRPL